MRKTFIYNEDVKKSAFTIMMLQEMGLKLVDSTEIEVGSKSARNDESAAGRMKKFNRLAFQRDIGKSGNLLF